MPKDFDDFLKTLTPELIKDISIRVSSNVNDSLFENTFSNEKDTQIIATSFSCAVELLRLYHEWSCTQSNLESQPSY